MSRTPPPDSDASEAIREYETRWALVSQGEPPPNRDDVLGVLPAAEQRRIRPWLDAIEQRYQKPASEVNSTQAPQQTIPANVVPEDDGGGPGHDPLARESATGEYDRNLPETLYNTSIFQDGEASEEIASPPPLPDIPGYEILGPLGRGGMGVVYRARQIGLNRLVALKMILSGVHARQEQLARFRAEAQAVAQLQHPHIVQVYEVGEHQGLPFFSLEFVEGRALHAEIRDNPIDPRRAAQLVLQVAQAMHHAHEHGIVHRDLKPGNILITSDGEAKVTDFGLVKRLEEDSSQTRTGSVMGTPSFMSPEQARGEKSVGPRTDIYAIGGVLYCALTGKPPFVGTTPMETLLQVRDDEPVAPSRLRPRIPVDLETICLKCLQKDPVKRYGSGAELADDLERFLAGDPISARRVGAAERGWRWCRRNPRLAGVSLLAAALLLFLAVGGPAAAIIIHGQKQYAERLAESEIRARVAVQNANREVHRQSQLVEQQRDVLERSLEKIVYEVHDNLRGPGVQQVKRDLLDIAIDGLKQMAEKNEERPSRIVITASAYRKLGLLCDQIGQTSMAIDLLQRSLDLQTSLHATAQLPKPLFNLANIHRDMGRVLLHLGRADQAQPHLQTSLDHWEAYARQGHSETNALKATGEVLGMLRRIATLRGDLETATRYCLRCVELRREWVQADPRGLDAQLEYSGALGSLSELYLNLGHVDEAVAEAAHARDVLENAQRQDPDHRGIRANIAVRHSWLGYLQNIRNQPQKAVQAYEQAVAGLKEQHEQDPLRADVLRNLTAAHYGLGVAHALCGQHDQAAPQLRTARELYEKQLAKDEGNASLKIKYLLTLARTGERLRAAQLAAELRGAHPDNAYFIVHAACAEALCADSLSRDSDAEDRQRLYDQHVERALGDIQTVLDLGFNLFFLLRCDPDLRPIQQHPRFVALIDAAEAAAADEGPAG